MLKVIVVPDRNQAVLKRFELSSRTNYDWRTAKDQLPYTAVSTNEPTSRSQTSRAI